MKSPRVVSDPEILGGTPVFTGTRVPVRIIFEHLEAGDSLEVFLEDCPYDGGMDVFSFSIQAAELAERYKLWQSSRPDRL